MAKSTFVKAMDNLPWIVKLILCLPVFNFVYGIYRIVKGVTQHKIVMTIVGILWIIPGGVLCWLIDMISTIVFRKPVVIA